MAIKKPSARRLFSAIALSSCLVTGLAAVSLAQGLPGLTIFSGVDREYQLGYRLDYEGRTNFRDRYRLRIPADKMDLAVARFAVSYPDTFAGQFDTDRIEIRVGGNSVPLDEVNWDEENRLIEIYPQEAIPAGRRVELVFSNVRNPRRPGTHYFNALVQSPGDVPLLRYIGTWIIQIGRN
ncbi:DUF2808 domain-containing protein [Oculatella sp. LEGE 06141]|uniref:DUF2808 domain-containing protein n=1 Tax=Oculatella sp. LEGE 06141 TaxID=1828648 RepID=UPI001881D585|nr:DUF2808 domain-containing protein [Oculatella sp. LEGE 06141]MBE9177585.1 DUF2808 domain-containing protein [Oculatella sp. LEGE 06141]